MRSPAQQLSTWPFADGFPWDEELIRCGRRALTTHGPAPRYTWTVTDHAAVPPEPQTSD